MKIEPRHLVFIHEYLTNGNNAKGAYMVAYPEVNEETAGKSGYVLRDKPEIQREIHKILASRFEEHNITEENIVQELASIAFFDIKDVLNDDGTVKKISDIPYYARRAIAALDLSELFEGYGDQREMTGYMKKLKVNCKMKALEMLGKYKQMFVDIKRIEGDDKKPIKVAFVDPDDLEDKVKNLMKRTVDEELGDALQ